MFFKELSPRKQGRRVRSGAAARGFTLVELLFVMVIVALALALVGTSISQSISGAEMRTAARKVTAAMRYTRTKAILSKSEQVFHLDTESLQYTAADREPAVGDPAVLDPDRERGVGRGDVHRRGDQDLAHDVPLDVQADDLLGVLADIPALQRLSINPLHPVIFGCRAK